MVSKLFETIDSSRDSVPIVDWGVKGTTMEDGEGQSCFMCIHRTPTAAHCTILCLINCFTQFEYNLKFVLSRSKHLHTSQK